MSSSSLVFSAGLHTLPKFSLRRSAPEISLTLRLSRGELTLRSPRLSTNFRRSDCRTTASMDEITAPEGKGKVQVFEAEEELADSLAKFTADLANKFAEEKGSFTIPIPSGNVFAINDALPAEAAADDYETCLKHLVKSKIIGQLETTGFPKFDLMLLGMGPDGHVASLFPSHPLIHEKTKWVTCVKDSPKPPSERISFTLPVINSSAYIALVVAGAGKANAIHAALGPSRSSKSLPVEMVSPEGEMTWFLDKGAASKL